MSEKTLVRSISKVLCRSSTNFGTYCNYCESYDGERCMKDMSDSFLEEAQAVVTYLLDQKVIKKAKLL